MLANRIKEATILDKDQPQFAPLWIAEAIANPARLVFLPVAFLLHPKSWKNMFCKQENENVDFIDDEEFIISVEGDDIEEPYSIRQSPKINFPYRNLLDEPQNFDEA